MSNFSTPASVRMNVLNGRIVSIGDFLLDETLAIPDYQRPYKWTERNLNQLLSDVVTHCDKSSYRLGTIVVHQNMEKRDIVDGQQRTISLLLIVRALLNRRKEREIGRRDLREQLDKLERRAINPSFENDVSKFNIHNNYLAACRYVSRSEFTEAQIDFLLNKCQVVVVELNDISEAFQFFDSQNARGRDLEPHDLLKAYHLREFDSADAPLKAKTVERWENSSTEELAMLLSQYLFRIRNWSRGVSARYFGKGDVDLFKGVNLKTTEGYPYVHILRIAHHFIDNYNDQYERRIDGRSLEFPFHLDQMIINGRRFFDFVSNYQEKVRQVRGESPRLLSENGGVVLSESAARILRTINSYPARQRTGDRYVRGMFDCLLIYYVDKFGLAEISRAIEKIFIWAYSLRLRMEVLQLASMDNYVLENNLFQKIKDATRPADFINIDLPVVAHKPGRTEKSAEIEKLFREMKYYE